MKTKWLDEVTHNVHYNTVKMLLFICMDEFCDPAFLEVQTVKNPSATQDTWVWSLGWEDPLEKGRSPGKGKIPWRREDPLEEEMDTHSSILTWKIPWTEEPGRLQWMELQRVGHDWTTFTTMDNQQYSKQIFLYSQSGISLIST